MKSGSWFAGTAIALVLGSLSHPASAQQSTETYKYDALGRLISVVTAGGQNNNETHTICYDNAGNRTDYVSDTTGSPATCATAPPPPPPPPPPPSTITLTTSGLSVLSAHQPTYNCSITDLPQYGIHFKECSLDAGGVNVFSESNGQMQFDPGYSMPSPYALEVTSSAYGTGQ